MGTYVIGDLHGCYQQWIDFKDHIEEIDIDAKFILIGDILDRGPSVRRLLGWCRLNISANGKYQMIMGNHEYEQINWERNKNKLRFYQKLPFYKDITINGQRFIIVHASLPESMVKEDGSLKTFNEITPSEAFDMVWSRSFRPFTAIPGAILVHGHSPTIFEDSFRKGEFSGDKLGKVYDLGNRYNVDCGAVYEHITGHRLAALRLDDMEIFYNDEDKYKRSDLISCGNEK